MKKHIVAHNFQISVEERRKAHQHNSFLIWFTGLSGSGKSTIANALEKELHSMKVSTYILDGDTIRNGINGELSFSPKDRTENIRRIAEVANLMIDAGLVVLASFVSPYKKDREAVKNTVKDLNFVEIFVATSLAECERRDVKGLYKRARAGQIENMTGISAPYEAPQSPDLRIDTELESVSGAVDKIMAFIMPKLQLKNE